MSDPVVRVWSWSLIRALAIAFLVGVAVIAGAYWLIGQVVETRIPSITGAQRFTASFALATALGALFALVVSARKQSLAEQIARREITAAFTERFRAAAAQLGGVAPAERLAGVYAMAALADEYFSGRQQCVDVLCGYLRLPFDPATDHLADRSTTSIRTGRDGRTVTTHENPASRPFDQQVRETIMTVIADHTRPAEGAPEGSWSKLSYNFNGAHLTNINLGHCVFAGPRTNFGMATFSGEATNFGMATFSGEDTWFVGATFSGKDTDFGRATFSGKHTNFGKATFSGVHTNFGKATFDGEDTWFVGATFSGEDTNFGKATFSGVHTWFRGATFSGEETWFVEARFAGEDTDFDRATFSGKHTNFGGATFSGVHTWFGGATFDGKHTNFDEATFYGKHTDFGKATFSGEATNFGRATFSGKHTDFVGATFSGKHTDFGKATFSGVHTDFGRATFSGVHTDFGGAMFSGEATDFGRATFSGEATNFGEAIFDGVVVVFDGVRPVRLVPGTLVSGLAKPDLRNGASITKDGSVFRGWDEPQGPSPAG